MLKTIVELFIFGYLKMEACTCLFHSPTVSSGRCLSVDDMTRLLDEFEFQITGLSQNAPMPSSLHSKFQTLCQYQFEFPKYLSRKKKQLTILYKERQIQELEKHLQQAEGVARFQLLKQRAMHGSIITILREELAKY